MEKELTPFQMFLLMVIAKLLNQEQGKIIAYLLEYSKIFKSKPEKENKRIRFTNSERIRLAKASRGIARKKLEEFSELLTPATLLKWFQSFISFKYGKPHKTPYSEIKNNQ